MDNASRKPVQPLSEEAAEQEARRILDAWKPDEPAKPLTATSFRDDSKVPKIGDTPHVPQPDSRIVPRWAAATAVVSIAVGAGSTGLGCAAWLFFRGLSMVSVPSLQTLVLVVLSPFVGAALLAVAVGAALSKVKAGRTVNVFKGSVDITHKTEVRSETRGVLTRTRNVINPS
ncbi:hypothetical protein [Streptomyces sp. NBC_00989]|uniref:hypothetical protein n=1 Tax=Streptomyces sp. NBC_00989 TaxID=2903705 RepID=UPI003867DEFD|nr:hypothetical protein OG714_38245 [Streptomyces sp. NBC_00989]